MGLAYRELIGSLYESWTIGIERVCKKLINSLIQQCQKCQKRGFEAKERGILTPFTYSPIRRLLPRRGGIVGTEKGNVATKIKRNLPLAPSERGNVATERRRDN